MRVIFLGTASAYPTPTRGVSCTALQLDDGQVWLFDCGEGSQIQIQKGSIKLGRINKIFITHMHGDHIFGLPGFICTLSTHVHDRPDFVLEIYGPHGIRRFIRETLSLSRSPLTFKYVVHEFMYIADQFPNHWNEWTVDHSASSILHPEEIQGRDIVAQEHVWDVFSDKQFSMKAGPISHRVPSFGYVFIESNHPGKINKKKLSELGIPFGPWCGKLKTGESVQFENGMVIHPADFLEQPRKGRKIVILGDTCNPYEMSSISSNCDLLLHEATVENSMKEKALENGHSTPEMAVKFAASIQAKRLILYHFSQRYKREKTEETDLCVSQLLEEAKSVLPDILCEILIADDLMSYEIPLE